MPRRWTPVYLQVQPLPLRPRDTTWKNHAGHKLFPSPSTRARRHASATTLTPPAPPLSPAQGLIKLCRLGLLSPHLTPQECNRVSVTCKGLRATARQVHYVLHGWSQRAQEAMTKGCMPLLKILRLQRYDLGVEGARLVAAGLNQVVSLIELDLSHCRIQADGVKHVARALSQTPALRVLALEDNGMQAAGAQALSLELWHVRQLEVLDLSSNALADAGVRSLVGVLTEMPILRVLRLCDNGIGRMGAKALATGVSRLGCVEVVDVRGNGTIGRDRVCEVHDGGEGGGEREKGRVMQWLEGSRHLTPELSQC